MTLAQTREARIGRLPESIQSAVALAHDPDWPPAPYLSLLEDEADPHQLGVMTAGLKLVTGRRQTEALIGFIQGLSNDVPDETVAANASLRVARQELYREQSGYRMDLIGKSSLEALPAYVRRVQAARLLGALQAGANIRMMPPDSGLLEANYIFVDHGVSRGTSAFVEAYNIEYGPNEVMTGIFDMELEYHPPDSPRAGELRVQVWEAWNSVEADRAGTLNVLQSMRS